MTYQIIYDTISQTLKKNGIKVIHRRPSKSSFGYFDFNNNKIVINSDIKGTKLGCIIISHELHHYIDCMNGKFPEFYSQKSKLPPKLILDAEYSAYLGAKKLLIKLKPKIKSHPLFNKKFLKDYCLDGWIAHYNKQN